MKIAFIHRGRNIQTGAHYINQLMSHELSERGVEIQHFYPREKLMEAPTHLRGIANILYFHGLLTRRAAMLKCDIVQGTTYTPLAFLTFKRPVVSHFGSTTEGFLRAVPRYQAVQDHLRLVWDELFARKVITERNLKVRRPLRDIAEIEKFVAKRASVVIATSAIVRNDLLSMGVEAENIRVVHNAIDNLWFENRPNHLGPPGLVYLGRLGHDVFTLKLKGLDRLTAVYRALPKLPKVTLAMTINKKIGPWLNETTQNQTIKTNLLQSEIKTELADRRGSVLLVTSRYEGFCLSLIEGMSQGLIPVAYRVGIAPEIIQDGLNGYLVDNFAEMIKRARLVAKDTRLRQRLSIAAMETADRFRANNMAKELLATYRDLLRDRHHSVKSSANHS